jgi:hypothetical protein
MMHVNNFKCFKLFINFLICKTENKNEKDNDLTNKLKPL